MNYAKLLKRCYLREDYIHTSAGGDYAIDVVGDTIYIYFECSHGLQDWLHNFCFPAKPYKNMSEEWRCHGGFLRLWRSMKDNIENRVAGLLIRHDNLSRIVCVGYSQGGSLAALATEDMTYLYGARIAVEGVGFGAARVVCGKLPASVQARFANFTTIRNKGDIVTKLPPLSFGYTHVGKMVEIGKYSPFKEHYASSYIGELELLDTKEKEKKE